MPQMLVDHQIRKGVLAGIPLHRKQYVYMSGKTIENAKHKLDSKIEDTMDRKNYVDIISRQ